MERKISSGAKGKRGARRRRGKEEVKEVKEDSEKGRGRELDKDDEEEDWKQEELR